DCAGARRGCARGGLRTSGPGLCPAPVAGRRGCACQPRRGAGRAPGGAGGVERRARRRQVARGRRTRPGAAAHRRERHPAAGPAGQRGRTLMRLRLAGRDLPTSKRPAARRPGACSAVLAVLLSLLLAACAAAPKRDLDYERIAAELAALESDPSLGELAGVERVRARQALQQLEMAARGDREVAAFVAERRVEIAEAAAQAEHAE